MKVRFKHEEIWRDAATLEEILLGKSEQFRYNYTNYTDGRKSMEIMYGSKVCTIFNPNETELIDHVFVVKDSSVVMYSPSHLKEVADTYQIEVNDNDFAPEHLTIVMVDGSGVRVDLTLYNEEDVHFIYDQIKKLI